MTYNPNNHYGMAAVRRWAFYNICAMMCQPDRGVPHGPQQWLESSPAAEKPRMGHETQRLFAPVDVMPGQTGLDL